MTRRWGRSSSDLAPNAPTDSFRALAVGFGHVCGLRFDDHVFCWGDNRLGQLAAAPSIGTYLSIDADSFMTCGVRSDGRIVCWGDDSSGQAHSLLAVP